MSMKQTREGIFLYREPKWSTESFNCLIKLSMCVTGKIPHYITNTIILQIRPPLLGAILLLVLYSQLSPGQSISCLALQLQLSRSSSLDIHSSLALALQLFMTAIQLELYRCHSQGFGSAFFFAVPDPDPGKNFYADPDPDPGGISYSTK